MKYTKQEKLKAILKECACQAMKDMHDMPSLDMGPKSIKVIRLGEPEIKDGLFPSLGKMDMDHDHHDDSHWDDDDQGEKSMIMSNLAKISDKANELRSLAAEVSDNEEWVQEKIAVASAMIDSIYNYLKYRE
jgi:hypothetical protein